MIYEELKRSFGGTNSTASYIVMAATSKVIATVSTYPYQVIRTRMQNERSGASVYDGVAKTVRRIFAQERIGGFYKGLFPNIIRVLPGTGITFGVYEGAVKLMRSSGW
jgi:solute carrier family 25 folate transporter 32